MRSPAFQLLLVLVLGVSVPGLAQFQEKKDQWRLELAIGKSFDSFDDRFIDHLHEAGFNLVRLGSGLFSSYGKGDPRPSELPPLSARIRIIRPSGWGLEQQLTCSARWYEALGKGAGLFGSPQINARLNYQTFSHAILVVKQLKASPAFAFNFKAGPMLSLFRVGVDREGNTPQTQYEQALFTHSSFRGGMLAEVQPSLNSKGGKGNGVFSAVIQVRYGFDFNYKALDIRSTEGQTVYQDLVSPLRLPNQSLFIGFSYGFRI